MSPAKKTEGPKPVPVSRSGKAGIDYPIGTPEELKEMSLGGDKFGSCSPRSQFNKGCPWFKKCLWPKVRDREDAKGRVGPVMVGIETVLAPMDGGAGDGKLMACHEFFRSGFDARRKKAPETGELINIVGIEGDNTTLETRYTMREHRTRAEGAALGCEACSDPKSVCMAREQKFRTVNLKDVRFMRPKERWPEAQASRRIKQRMVAQLRHADDDAMLRAAGVNPDELPPEGGGDTELVMGGGSG